VPAPGRSTSTMLRRAWISLAAKLRPKVRSGPQSQRPVEAVLDRPLRRNWH
jgi:hypothetical protein